MQAASTAAIRALLECHVFAVINFHLRIRVKKTKNRDAKLAVSGMEQSHCRLQHLVSNMRTRFCDGIIDM